MLVGDLRARPEIARGITRVALHRLGVEHEQLVLAVPPADEHLRPCVVPVVDHVLRGVVAHLAVGRPARVALRRDRVPVRAEVLADPDAVRPDCKPRLLRVRRRDDPRRRVEARVAVLFLLVVLQRPVASHRLVQRVVVRAPARVVSLRQVPVAAHRVERDAAAVAGQRPLPGGIAGPLEHAVVLSARDEDGLARRMARDVARLDHGQPVVAFAPGVALAAARRPVDPAVAHDPEIDVGAALRECRAVDVWVDAVPDERRVLARAVRLRVVRRVVVETQHPGGLLDLALEERRVVILDRRTAEDDDLGVVRVDGDDHVVARLPDRVLRELVLGNPGPALSLLFLLAGGGGAEQGGGNVLDRLRGRVVDPPQPRPVAERVDDASVRRRGERDAAFLHAGEVDLSERRPSRIRAPHAAAHDRDPEVRRGPEDVGDHGRRVERSDRRLRPVVGAGAAGPNVEAPAARGDELIGMVGAHREPVDAGAGERHAFPVPDRREEIRARLRSRSARLEHADTRELPRGTAGTPRRRLAGADVDGVVLAVRGLVPVDDEAPGGKRIRVVVELLDLGRREPAAERQPRSALVARVPDAALRARGVHALAVRAHVHLQHASGDVRRLGGLAAEHRRRPERQPEILEPIRPCHRRRHCTCPPDGSGAMRM